MLVTRKNEKICVDEHELTQFVTMSRIPLRLGWVILHVHFFFLKRRKKIGARSIWFSRAFSRLLYTSLCISAHKKTALQENCDPRCILHQPDQIVVLL